MYLQALRESRALAPAATLGGAAVPANRQLVTVPQQPTDPLVWVWAALSALQAGDIAPARTQLRQALRGGAPRAIIARLLLAQTATHLGRAALFVEQPALYLEIGVDAGLSLARAQGPAIGVDPRPDLPLAAPLGPQARLITASSDAFFREQAAALLHPRPELVFIDGMHLFEFALRDFMQVERHAAPATLVVIDDIFPCHPTQAERRRRSGAWTGDVWTLHQILRETRPDLTLLALNANTTGLLLIAGLDPDNQILWDAYPRLTRDAAHEQPPPPEVLARHAAIPSDHPLVERLLDILREARDQDWTGTRVRGALTELKPEIAAAQRTGLNHSLQAEA